MLIPGPAYPPEPRRACRTTGSIRDRHDWRALLCSRTILPEDEYSFVASRPGAGNRLDFTCIGLAVNLTVRPEKLPRQIRVGDRRFRRVRGSRCPHEFAALGESTLLGFAHANVFGLEDDHPSRKL
jgi:hypothetical protein